MTPRRSADTEGGELRAPAPLRPGSLASVRQKRWHKNAKLTEEQVRTLHTIHITRGMSMRELSRQGWQRWGYASEKSCLVSVCALMDSLGLERRDRVEATVLASTTHGKGSRADKAAYKRWRRREIGPWPSDRRSSSAVALSPFGLAVPYASEGETLTTPGPSAAPAANLTNGEGHCVSW